MPRAAPRAAPPAAPRAAPPAARRAARRPRRLPVCAAALAGAAALQGCHGVFLGQGYRSETLPHRTVNAWPLVEVEEQPETGESRTQALAGFVYHHDDPQADTCHAAAFPFFWRERAGEETRTRVPPFYWHEAGAEGASTTLWPLFSHRRAGEARRVSALSELVRVERDPDEDRVAVSAPRGVVEYRRHGEEVDLYLLGYRGASLARWRSGSEGRQAHLLPLAYYRSERGGAEGDAEPGGSLLLSPLAAARRRGDEVEGFALPGVVWRRSGETLRLWLLGAVAGYRSEGGDPRAGHVLGWGPVALAGFARDGERSRAHVLPLFFRRVDDDSAFTALTPLYWRSRDLASGASRTLVLPLLHVYRGPERARWDLLYPLLHYEAEAGGASRGSVLFHLVRWQREGEDAHDLRVLHKLFRHRRDGSRVEVALNPLFTDTRDDAAGYRSLSLLVALYRYERRGEERTHRILHFIRF